MSEITDPRAQVPLEYYFEVRKGDGTAALYPGFAASLTAQPYFVVLANGGTS